MVSDSASRELVPKDGAFLRSAKDVGGEIELMSKLDPAARLDSWEAESSSCWMTVAPGREAKPSLSRCCPRSGELVDLRLACF